MNYGQVVYYWFFSDRFRFYLYTDALGWYDGSNLLAVKMEDTLL